MTDTTLDLSSGALLGGRYRLLAEIGQGGMASVHRARDEKLHREVAVKVLHAHLASDDTFRDRFTREGRAAASLAHPNVVTVHDAGQEGHRAFLVMELIEGRSLRAVLDARGRLSPPEALSLLEPAAGGLGAAHAAGMVHRDVKPENVLYGPDGTGKVTDFGLARAAAASTRTFGSGVIVGSPHYLSPEAVDGRTVDARGDVYALGVVLFECLTGRRPFEGDSPLATAVARTRGDVPAPSTAVPDVPPGLDRVVATATARDPGERYADAGAFADALRGAVPGGPRPVDLRDLDGGTVVLPVEADVTRPTAVADTPPAQPAGGEGAATTVTDRGGGVGPDRTWVRLALVALVAVAAGALVMWDQVLAPVTPIPAVTDTPVEAAQEQLRRAGFVPTVADERPNSLEVTEGSVLRTDPSGEARQGDLVTLVVSAGPPQVTVPSVAGTDAEAAVARLEEQQLNPEVSRAYHREVPEGAVIRTEPAAGETVDATSSVTVVVSRGREPIPVPGVGGEPLDAARAALSDAGLEPSVVERVHHQQVPAGAVVSQSPDGGAELHRGDTVELVVSRGAEPVEMPDVQGETEQRAREILEGRGLEVRVREVETLPIFNEEGTVADQEPTPGTEVRRGEEVTILVWV